MIPAPIIDSTETNQEHFRSMGNGLELLANIILAGGIIVGAAALLYFTFKEISSTPKQTNTIPHSIFYR